MRHLMKIASLTAVTLTFILAGSAPAEAHGWRNGRHVRTYVTPFRIAVIPRIVVPRPVFFAGRAVGALDFDVEPEESAVFVDGVFRGTADDLDGFPSVLYLAAGPHRITLRSPVGRVWSSTITVLPGREIDINTRLGR